MIWIKDLSLRMPPPSSPFEITPINWSNVENQLGVALPSDYKEFISIYGTGSISDFLWILNPIASNKNLNLLQSVSHDQNSYSQMKEMFPEEYTRSLLPDEGAFLLWAMTDNGDAISWSVSGEPDSWTVGIYNVDDRDHESFGITMREFLFALVDGKLTSAHLPDEFLKSKKIFSSAA